MSQTGARYDFPKTWVGDTIAARDIVVERDDVVEDLSSVVITMTIEDPYTRNVLATMTNGSGVITASDKVSIEAFIAPSPEQNRIKADLEYRINFLYPNAKSKTYLYGVIPVIKDQTNA